MIIIAEAGINHNGSLLKAMKLVDAAIYADADAIKFQTFWNIGRLEEYEFTITEWFKLKKYCDKKEIMFLSTPHCLSAIDFLDNLIPIYKIASPYICDEKFIKKISSKDKSILISAGSLKNKDGMATDDEIIRALKWIGRDSNIILLHCVSKYPCENPNYERIDELKKHCMNIGLSDHSKNLNPPKGLSVYENHIMLENEKCIDEGVSLNPEQFKEMVEWLRSS